ncbi:MAG: hypothetical protein QNJ55_12565 [Xenococcus sp. MO_188.B8]|nr:hypothetical protein [Xenococcus sp. MO_188.B8]
MESYDRKMMTPKELLIQELDDTPEPVIVEVLDFLHFLKAKQEQDNEDLRDARAALASVSTEGTVAWDALKAEVGL